MKVADDLKPHNQETIEKILKFYETERKCCAIQATGTGKTFLILRLLEIFNDEGKVAVIFAPNNEIIKQTKKRMKKFGLNNAAFYTYQKLARMTNEEISGIKADLIVCDELHRTGAKTWGEKFEVLVNTHPDSKVFGVTATPLRCVDGRDMSEEYFDGNKVCDISLAEALVREIIPVMPLYVSALYTFEEEYQNMADKIEKANNSNEEKIELHKELLAAKQQLEKANGVPEIIRKYITNYNGKYLVFCKDKKHLYAMKDVVVGWFREAGYDGKIFEYPYYSDSSAVKRNLENFENNKEEGLKLLFIIDKLNEGLHLEEVHGCILLRTTVSNIIYYQQIGRAIDAGSNEKRVILDLVSNFNSLKSFNLKKELEEKVKERKEGKFFECSEEFELDKFDVVDCVQECIDVFNSIDDKLYGEWDIKISALQQYYDREGHSNVPQNHIERINNREIKLGAFVAGIRQNDYSLTKEREDQLTSVQFIYDANEYKWDIFLEGLKEYKKQYGDCNVPYQYIITKDNQQIKLGWMCSSLRTREKRGVVDKTLICKLNEIGFIWDVDKFMFMKNIENVKQFCKDRKCSIYEIKQIHNDKEQLKIFRFIKGQKKNLKKGLYEHGKYTYKKEILKTIGITEKCADTAWEFMFNEWIIAKEKFDNKIPGWYKASNGNNLRNWIIIQRTKANNETLSDKRLKKLKDNGFIFEKNYNNVKRINVYYKGKFLNRFDSIKEAKDKCQFLYGIKFDGKVIAEILNGRRNDYHGYYFEKVV